VDTYESINACHTVTWYTNLLTAPSSNYFPWK